jgi:hypothetical protein
MLMIKSYILAIDAIDYFPLGFESFIGYSEVKNKPTYFGMPTSCDNLKGAGHISSGFYSIKGSAMMESVFCDFTKLPSDEGKYFYHFIVEKNYFYRCKKDLKNGLDTPT